MAKYGLASLLALAAIATPMCSDADSPPSTVLAPFVETYQKQGKTLIYVGAVHHSPLTYPDAMTDPVFETVAKVFSEGAPEAVIVEGVDPSEMSGFLRFSKQCAAANYNLAEQLCDEPEYVAYTATQIGAAVYTGEPSAPAVLSYFESKGYVVQDFLAYYVMINIPVQNHHTPLTSVSFSAFEQKVVKNTEQELGISVPFAAGDFAAWYAKNMPSPPNYFDLTTNDTGPSIPGQTPTLLSKFSSVDSAMRDGSVVATIQEALGKYDRVLVVYGASHVVFEWNQLEQMLGVPTYSKPF